jgi:hypothetical protein
MTTAPPASRPPISVTVSTVQGWPEIERELTTVLASVRSAGGELIVTDGSTFPEPELGPDVTWLKYPSESVLKLRGRAYGHARGEVVAITEDHVRVAEDWATRHVDAHRRHPEALAIGGSVENGATDTIIDWAGFLAVQSPIVAPIKTGPAGRMAGALNVSYKRAALTEVDDHDGLGVLDTWHQKALAARQAVLLNDDSIRVTHDQALGWRGMTQIHFDAARTFAGFRRRRLGPVDAVWILGAPVLPFVRTARAIRHLVPKGHGRLAARCAPAILWLFAVQAVGNLTGYLLGPGDSPLKVQ